jgi:hypothetical protein
MNATPDAEQHIAWRRLFAEVQVHRILARNRPSLNFGEEQAGRPLI